MILTQNLFIAILYLVYGCNEELKPINELKQDSVVVLPKSRNLGKVNNTEMVVLNFEILNHSNKDVKIVSKAKSCGCTNFLISSDTLKAKSRTKVKIDFDPKQVSGDFEKSVFFRLESGKILLFKFSGTVD